MSARVLRNVALTVLLLAAVCGVASNRTFYQSAMSQEFFSVVFVSVIFIHLRLRPSWKDAAAIVVLAPLFSVLEFNIRHFDRYVVAWFSFLGLASVLVMGAGCIWKEGRERRTVLLAFVPSILILASNFFAGYAHLWTEHAHPRVLDLYLFSFDSSLHAQIAFWLGQGFAASPAFHAIGMFFYVGLPLSIAMVYAGQASRIRERAIPLFLTFFLVGPLGVLFYNWFPALGPVHLFAERFPWHPLTVDQARRLLLEPVAIPGLRNAIPSLHMAWVLLAFWYSRGLSIWERGVAALFVIFTVCATLGTGEHYLIDLVVAYPFAVFAAGLCELNLPWTSAMRWLAAGGGFAMTAAWLVALRYTPHMFWVSSVLPWTLCAVTVVASEALRRRLQVETAGAVSASAPGPAREDAALVPGGGPIPL